MTALICLGAILLSSCSGTRIRHLDADAFLRQTERIPPVDSAMWTTYIGQTGTRVYLEHGDLITLTGKPRITVYWTEMKGLPAPVAEQLREGRNPWTWPPGKDVKGPGFEPSPKK